LFVKYTWICQGFFHSQFQVAEGVCTVIKGVRVLGTVRGISNAIGIDGLVGRSAQPRQVPIKLGPPGVHCKAFKDNLGALEMARMPKMRPRTRHINVKYHHFREAVAAKRVSIQHVSNALTKNLQRDLFVLLRRRYMGW
jgi:hypothetical protein